MIELTVPATKPDLRAPFPYFGGKSRVAHLVWERFGNVPNYVEPFAGSLAVLLGRPHAAKTETVNDLDCYLSNFWRALQAVPDKVARYADWPVNEADLHARHKWLLAQTDFRERMRREPDFYDARIAGWWVFGASSCVGNDWHRSKLPNSIPHLSDAGTGVARYKSSESLKSYLQDLATRLRYVRVCCGEWLRCTGPSVTEKHGITGIFLDPPYGEGEVNYSAGGNTCDSVAQSVAAWAQENGTNPLLRIALCGYEGTIEMPDDWECVAWKARGGYGGGLGGQADINRGRERIWFSPHCLNPDQQKGLFE